MIMVLWLITVLSGKGYANMSLYIVDKLVYIVSLGGEAVRCMADPRSVATGRRARQC